MIKFADMFAGGGGTTTGALNVPGIHVSWAINYGIDQPLASITTEEKFQFITAIFSSSGNQETQNQSLNKPLNTILTGTNKKALITAIKKGIIDFDIKMRFLTINEQASIMGFPEGYFDKIKTNQKQKQKMIGNSVPVYMAELLIKNAYKSLINNKKQVYEANRV